MSKPTPVEQLPARYRIRDSLGNLRYLLPAEGAFGRLTYNVVGADGTALSWSYVVASDAMGFKIEFCNAKTNGARLALLRQRMGARESAEMIP